MLNKMSINTLKKYFKYHLNFITGYTPIKKYNKKNNIY